MPAQGRHGAIMGAAASVPSMGKEQDQLYIRDTKTSSFPLWKSASTDPTGWKEKEGEQSPAQPPARRRHRCGESPPKRIFCLRQQK